MALPRIAVSHKVVDARRGPHRVCGVVERVIG